MSNIMWQKYQSEEATIRSINIVLLHVDFDWLLTSIRHILCILQNRRDYFFHAKRCTSYKYDQQVYAVFGKIVS